MFCSQRENFIDISIKIIIVFYLCSVRNNDNNNSNNFTAVCCLSLTSFPEFSRSLRKMPRSQTCANSTKPQTDKKLLNREKCASAVDDFMGIFKISL